MYCTINAMKLSEMTLYYGCLTCLDIDSRKTLLTSLEILCTKVSVPPKMGFFSFDATKIYHDVLPDSRHSPRASSKTNIEIFAQVNVSPRYLTSSYC